MSVVVRPVEPRDIERVLRLARESFRIRYVTEPWLRSGWVLEEEGEVRAVCLAEPLGQFYGGRSVPVTMLSSMTVAIEHRGRGLGAHLILQVMAACKERGFPLAVHYPRVFSTFRRVGFEFAGVRNTYSVPLSSLPSAKPTTVSTWDDSDFDAIARCYRRFAAQSSGLLDRTARSWWERVLGPSGDDDVYRYCYRDSESDEILGYLALHEKPSSGRDTPLYDLVARDFAWNTRPAAEALLGMLSFHAPIGRNLRWNGPVDEPLFTVLNGEYWQDESHRWMCRLVDVPAALAQRGYPRSLHTSLDIVVNDHVLPGNGGAFRLEVAGGSATVTPVRSARMRTDVGTLAALYTGWLAARDAVRIERLHGASEDEIATLELIFAGPKPWLLETGVFAGTPLGQGPEYRSGESAETPLLEMGRRL